MPHVRAIRPRPNQPASAAYTGIWANFSSYVNVLPNGEIFFVVKNAGNTKSNVYKSSDYGDSWELFVTEAEMGGVVSSFTPTAAGYVGAGTQALMFSADLVTWANKLSQLAKGLAADGVSGQVWSPPGAPGNVWCQAFGNGYISEWYMGYSADGGANWVYNNNGVGDSITTTGKLRIKDDLSIGIFGCAMSGSGQYPHKTTTPTVEGGAVWAAIASLANYRGPRPGIAFPRLVCGGIASGLSADECAFSSDNGDNFSIKALPAGMVHTGDLYHDDDITCFGDIVMAHKIECVIPGIYRSLDFGDSWTRLRAPFGTQVANCGIEIDPYNSNIIYAWGNSTGFWRSDDGGAHWYVRSKGLGVGQD